MIKYKFYLLLFLIATPLMLLNVPVTSASEGETIFLKDDSNYYRVRIEASQWEYKAYDLNKAAANNVDLDTASKEDKEAYEVKHRIEMPDAQKGDYIEWHLYSRDVQHGFSINELEVAVALNRPEPGNEFGAATIIERELIAEELGDSDNGEGQGVTYSSFCHIFCGLGHPDMKLKFVLGGGAIEFGPYVFYAAIVLNISIFALTFRSIVNKIQLVPTETTA